MFKNPIILAPADPPTRRHHHAARRRRPSASPPSVSLNNPTPEEPGFDDAEQLHIDPDECIDCDACVEACPVDAVMSEDRVPAEMHRYIEINASYFA